MDHNNTQEGTLGGTLARLDGGIVMGSSHSIDGRTIPAQACIARMFVWGLERGKCEGGLHGEFSACVFGWAQVTACCGNCVCAFDASKHQVTFLNRHVAAVRCCAGGTSELEAIAPKFY